MAAQDRSCSPLKSLRRPRYWTTTAPARTWRGPLRQRRTPGSVMPTATTGAEYSRSKASPCLPGCSPQTLQCSASTPGTQRASTSPCGTPQTHTPRLRGAAHGAVRVFSTAVGSSPSALDCSARSPAAARRLLPRPPQREKIASATKRPPSTAQRSHLRRERVPSRSSTCGPHGASHASKNSLCWQAFTGNFTDRASRCSLCRWTALEIVSASTPW